MATFWENCFNFIKFIHRTGAEHGSKCKRNA